MAHWQLAKTLPVKPQALTKALLVNPQVLIKAILVNPQVLTKALLVNPQVLRLPSPQPSKRSRMHSPATTLLSPSS
jgi:hypothetical protein